VVGYTTSGDPVTAEQLKAAGAMTVIMRDAIKPNLLQTLENTPVLVHAGPFGNIAHGNSSVVADLIGIHSGEYLITEAGFGSDMGAERFFNIKCRTSGLVPDAAVVVATVRALKVHSGRHKVAAGRPLPPEMLEENPEEVRLGAANLLAHLAIVRRHGVTPVVAINAFPEDFASEHEAIREIAASVGVRTPSAPTSSTAGREPVELAEAVVEAADEPSEFRLLYETEPRCAEKISAIATEVYGADGVDYLPSGCPPARHLRAGRLRIAPGVHRQDPPVHLLGPTLKGAPRGGACRSERPGPMWGPASCTWSAGTCGPCPASLPARRPSGSTSTSTATWSGCTETREDHGHRLHSRP
jgi:formate--tetrahydrofolate ligase